MTDISSSVVLITGAASGIGRLMAVGAAARGARVVAWDIDGTGLAQLAADLPDSVHPFVVDITNADAVQATAEAVRGQIGEVDVLILNAGVVSGRRIMDLPREAIRRTFEVNALALFWCVQAFLPAMVDRGAGHIVTIASVAGIIPSPGATDYGASKHAAYGFAESLRTELADDAPGVRTTVVLPQVIDTGMFAGVGTPRLFPPLKPDYVADRILGAVESDQQRLLLDRPALLTGYLIRPLPPRLSDRVLRMFGVFRSMSTFHGRSIVDRVADR